LALSDNANNAFASTSVAANKDGSVLERLEDITQELSGSTGIATYPAAAAAANNVSIAEVLRYVQDMVATTSLNRNATNYLVVQGTMSSATWNTVASHEILTVTGLCRIVIVPEINGTLTSAGGAATLVLGDETTTDTRTVAKRSVYEALDFLSAGKDIGYTIGTEALTGGEINFHVWWQPLQAASSVVAGAGGAL
jgi:hypothetical protein